jgi:hypothetical protein
VPFEDVAEKKDHVRFQLPDLSHTGSQPFLTNEGAQMGVRHHDNDGPVAFGRQAGNFNLVTVHNGRAQPLNESDQGKQATRNQRPTSKRRRSFPEKKTESGGKVGSEHADEEQKQRRQPAHPEQFQPRGGTPTAGMLQEAAEEEAGPKSQPDSQQ